MNMENNSDMNKMINQNNNINNNNNEDNIQGSISPFSNAMNNDPNSNLPMSDLNNINVMGMNPTNMNDQMKIEETSHQEKGNDIGEKLQIKK